MRRPSSSSCLLLPKGSPESARENDVAAATATSGITILSKEKLPKFSCERFYLLSEIEVHAHPTIFLCDQQHQHAEDNSTQATEESEEDLAAFRDTTTTTEDEPASQPSSSSFWSPPFLLLYVLWRPDMPSDPRTFVETYLLEAVTRLREHVEPVISISGSSLDESSKSPLRRASSGSSLAITPPSSPRRQRDDSEQKGGGTDAATAEANSSSSPSPKQKQQEAEADQPSHRPKVSLYLVVDRLMPAAAEATATSSDDNNSSLNAAADQEELEEDLAERLARTVASHPVLRTCTQGITVGISNHRRAAPALEACVEAITWGAPDRRRFVAAAAKTTKTDDKTRTNDDAQKSLLGIVSTAPDELLGLQDASVTDAAQGVWQAKVTAEWNGNGNLPTFAKRAHQQWAQKHGVMLDSNSTGGDGASSSSSSLSLNKRRFPRRVPRTARQPAVARGGGRRHNDAARRRELRNDVLAVTLVLSYFFFHFKRECWEYAQWLYRTVTMVWSYVSDREF